MLMTFDPQQKIVSSQTWALSFQWVVSELTKFVQNNPHYSVMELGDVTCKKGQNLVNSLGGSWGKLVMNELVLKRTTGLSHVSDELWGPPWYFWGVAVHFHCYDKITKNNNLKEERFILAPRARASRLWLLTKTYCLWAVMKQCMTEQSQSPRGSWEVRRRHMGPEQNIAC